MRLSLIVVLIAIGFANCRRIERQAETGPLTGTPFASVLNVFSQFSNLQSVFSGLQQAITAMTSQLTNLVQSSTRIVGGGGSGPSHFQELDNDKNGNEIVSGPNFGEALIGSLTDMTRNVDGLGTVLRELNGQLSRMIETGSRLVTGLEAETVPSSSSETTTSNPLEGFVPGANLIPNQELAPTDALLRTLASLTTQITELNKILAEATGQVSRIVATSSKFITGNQGPSPFETFINTMQSATRQFDQFQDILRSMNGQFNRIVETSAKAINGGPISAISGVFSSGSRRTRQAEVIDTLDELVNGDEDREESSSNGQSPPSAMVLSIVERFSSQIAAFQRILSALSSQFNDMVASTTRALTGGFRPSSRTRRQAESAQSVIDGLQAAAAQLTRQFGNLGATFARIAQGATGVRITGNGDDRGTFSTLNPVAVIGRQVGSLAGSINRAISG